jgi:hypothetical protein
MFKVKITREIFDNEWGESFIKSILQNEDYNGNLLLGYDCESNFTQFFCGQWVDSVIIDFDKLTKVDFKQFVETPVEFDVNLCIMRFNGELVENVVLKSINEECWIWGEPNKTSSRDYGFVSTASFNLKWLSTQDGIEALK